MRRQWIGCAYPALDAKQSKMIVTKRDAPRAACVLNHVLLIVAVTHCTLPTPAATVSALLVACC